MIGLEKICPELGDEAADLEAGRSPQQYRPIGDWSGEMTVLHSLLTETETALMRRAPVSYLRLLQAALALQWPRLRVSIEAATRRREFEC